MTFLILAGGMGTRLRPVVQNVPKPMAPIGGRPFLDILLNSLSGFSPERVIMCVSYLRDKIMERYGNEFNRVHIDYSIEESPLGTGGAIWNVFRNFDLDKCIVINGDTFLRMDYGEFASQCTTAPLGIALTHVADCGRYGKVCIENGRIVEFMEKKGNLGPGLINAGVYYITKNIIRPMPEKFSFENDFLQPRIAAIPHKYFIADGYFIDIGVPESYAKACREISAIKNANVQKSPW